MWVRGSWAGLGLAVGFTALANVLAATALVWTEWLPSRLKWIGAAALAVMLDRVARVDLPPRDILLNGTLIVRESCGAVDPEHDHRP